MLLAGKKVVVVGGSSGIGLSTAEMAKREGAEIIVASRNVERLDKAAEKLNAIAESGVNEQAASGMQAEGDEDEGEEEEAMPARGGSRRSAAAASISRRTPRKRR